MGLSVHITDHSGLFQKATEEQAKDALEAVGIQAEGYTAQNAPVRTGRLRASITHKTQGKTTYIGTNVEYAPYVEYGTSRMSPRYFLTNAINGHLDEYVEILKHYLQK